MTANHKIPVSSCLLVSFHGASAAQMRLAHIWTRTGPQRERKQPKRCERVTSESEQCKHSDNGLYFIGEETHFIF